MKATAGSVLLWASTAGVVMLVAGCHRQSVPAEPQFVCSVDLSGVTVHRYNGSGSTVTIPNVLYGVPVRCIGTGAFKSCLRLAHVTIPNGVSTVHDVAFAYCTNLASITVPDSVSDIGIGAFEHCYSLTSVTIPT